MKVLLVRLSSMGDLIHTLPAVEDLARAHPDIELHWLCESGFSDIARLHPFVKKIHIMKWRYWRKHLFKLSTWREICRLKNLLKHEQYDFVLDSQGLLKSSIFSLFAGSKIKGLNGKSAREKYASWFYDQTFSVDKNKNAVWRNRNLFEQVFSYEMPELNFGVSVPAECRLKNVSQPFYVCLHASSKDSKLWLESYWQQLFELLHQNNQALIYLPWGNDKEKERAERIAAEFPFVIVCNKMRLLELASLIEQAEGVIGVDTGLLHLANALDKPVVGIYTDTNPAKTGVQTSDWAKNIGGVGQMPSVHEVFHTLSECVFAKKQNKL